MEETSEYEVGPVLEPSEQQTILFYGKPLIVVRLPNGEPGVVLNQLCENMGLEPRPQLRRIRRTKALAQGLNSARIETPGGSQVMYALTLKVTPAWLFGIDAHRAKEDMREEIERYQAECVDVLYRWASTPRLEVEAPADLVPVEQITRPEAPRQGASPQEWLSYHQQMAAFLAWQMDVETWRGQIDTRLGKLEAIVPAILQQIGPPRITIEHQTLVQFYVSQLGAATNKSHETIYALLKTAFRVPRYNEIPESDWPRVEQWFRIQFPGQKLPESTTQSELF